MIRRAVWPMVRASHVQPTVAVTAFTTALAAGAGRGWRSSRVAAAVLAGQLAVGWSNDYLDRDRDRLVGRVDKPIVAGEVPAAAVGVGAVVAALACVPLSLLSGRRAAFVHAMAVGSAMAYNGWLKRTACSVVPYAVSFGALPVFVSLGSDARSRPPVSAIAAAALMGAGAHFVNSLADIDDDIVTGVTGLPQRLGPTRSLVVGTLLLAGSAAVVMRSGGRPAGRAASMLAASIGASVLGVVTTARTGRRRVAWSTSLVTAALTVALYLVRRPAPRAVSTS